MLPFVLYSVTALVTGFHVYILLTAAVYGYGAVINPLELVALLGSVCLLLAAYVGLFRPRGAAKLALVAALAIWCFYGPAIANLVRAKFEKRGASSQVTSARPSGRSLKWNLEAALALMRLSDQRDPRIG